MCEEDEAEYEYCLSGCYWLGRLATFTYTQNSPARAHQKCPAPKVCQNASVTKQPHGLSVRVMAHVAYDAYAYLVTVRLSQGRLSRSLVGKKVRGVSERTSEDFVA